MIGFVTGSDGPSSLKEGLGDLTDAHAGLVFKGGMARIAMSPPPEITAPIEAVDEWNDACGLLGFVMYALDREDWMKEFVAYEELIQESIMEAVDTARINEARSRLRVIQGGQDGSDEGK